MTSANGCEASARDRRPRRRIGCDLEICEPPRLLCTVIRSSLGLPKRQRSANNQPLSATGSMTATGTMRGSNTVTQVATLSTATPDGAISNIVAVVNRHQNYI